MPAQTIADVLANTTDNIIFSIGRAMPETMNWLAEQALKTDATHIWFVDDDMGFPYNMLFSLAELNTDIAIADYPVTESGGRAVQTKAGYTFGGFGTTLIKREVLEAMKEDYGWFRTTMSYVGDDLRPHPTSEDAYRHGGHDVDFYIRSQNKGFKVEVSKVQGWQYKLLELSKRKGNNTIDIIEKWEIK